MIKSLASALASVFPSDGKKNKNKNAKDISRSPEPFLWVNWQNVNISLRGFDLVLDYLTEVDHFSTALKGM